MTATIRDAMTDPSLFGDTFGNESFAAWRALLSGFYGLELDETEAEIFKAITGRTERPAGAHDELWLAVGRRGGKSHVAALVGSFEAAFTDHRHKLAAGEWATVMLLAADRAQARTLLRYVRGIFQHPMLKPLVARETETSLELTTRTAIEVHTASHRAVRGYTLAAAICDEIAFWHSDGARPDAEIIAALKPALATLGGKLIALSSPYARRGQLWEVYKRHFGQNDASVLVAQAPSTTMNPTLAQSIVDRALAEDPERAGAEYLAQFRSDIASLLDPETIDACTRPRPVELPRDSKTIYRAFCDPSGGGADGFTLAISHADRDTAVIDLVRERHGSPASIVVEFAAILKSYGIFRVMGDRYAGRWPRDEFQKHGITYETSDLDRTGLYLELLARLNSGQVELPPDKKLTRQLVALERRTSRAGRDIIDHAPGAHDDLANAVAGAVALVKKPKLQSTTRLLQMPI